MSTWIWDFHALLVTTAAWKREQTEETNRTEISQMDGGEQGTRDMMCWAHPRGQKHCDRMRESLAPIEDDIWELISLIAS